MFWPGSDVEIAGDRPTYWRVYRAHVANDERVDQVLAWLRQPEPSARRSSRLLQRRRQRRARRRAGLAERCATPVAQVDDVIARLVAGVEAAGLTARTNFVLVSDHGMAAARAAIA